MFAGCVPLRLGALSNVCSVPAGGCNVYFPTLECRFQSLLLNKGRRNGGLCSLLPGPLALICCNRASTLNTKHIDVLESPGGSLPALVRGAWHAGRERGGCLACAPSGASGMSQLIICQELCPLRGQRVGRGAGVPSPMPRRGACGHGGPPQVPGHCGHSSGLWTNDRNEWKEGRKKERKKEGKKTEGGGMQAQCRPAVVFD